MQPRIRTSEPAYRAPISQSQRDRMGRVQPMKRTYFYPMESHGETLPVGKWEGRITLAIMFVASLVVIVTGLGS